MTAHEDRDLKDAFDALGGMVRENVPAFDALTSRKALQAARWRQRRHRAALLVAAAAIPAILVLRAPSARAPDYERFTALTGIDLGEVTWRAPSDFLLDVPGRDLLRSVPLVEIHAPVIAPDSAGRSTDSRDTARRSRS